MKITKKAHNSKGTTDKESQEHVEKTLTELIAEEENQLINTEATKEESVINFDEMDLEGEDHKGVNESEFTNPFEVEVKEVKENVFNLDEIMAEPLTTEPSTNDEVSEPLEEKPKKESKFGTMKVGKKSKKAVEKETNLDDLLVGNVSEDLLNVDDGEEITLADIKSELNDKAHNYKNNVKWWEKGFNIGALSVVTVLALVVGYQFGVVDLITDGYSHIQLLLGNANIDGRAKELTNEAKTEMGISTEAESTEDGQLNQDSATLELSPEEIAAMQAAEEAAKLTDAQLAAQAEAESIAKETGTVLPGRYIIGQNLDAGLYYAGTGTYSVWNSETDIKINIAPSVRMVNYGKLVTLTEGQVLQFSAGTLVWDETRPHRQVTTLTPGDDFVIGKDLVLGEYEIINPGGRDNPIMLAVIPAEGDTYSIRIQEKTYQTFKEGDILSPEGQLNVYNVN